MKPEYQLKILYKDRKKNSEVCSHRIHLEIILLKLEKL